MIAIIDSGVANIASVVFALARLGKQAVVTRDPAVIQSASHVILPGVGAASAAMQNLKAHDLVDVIKSLKQPVLGICLGMQLMYEKTEEGDIDCLGIFPGEIKKLIGDDLIIPHMGWNDLTTLNAGALFSGLPQKAYVYFVHSFHAPINQTTCASSRYGSDFTAISQKDNFTAMQFHPERSGKVGALLLNNFLNL